MQPADYPIACTNGVIRLANGSNEFEGRVEICLNDTFGTVCGTTSWNENNAKVVCRQLGYEMEGLCKCLLDTIL